MQPKEKLLYYNMLPKTVRTNGKVSVEKYCNGFDVVNTGNTIAIVNGTPLNPPAVGEVLGDSFSFGGNKGEIYIGTIDVSFQAITGGQQVIVTQKIYVPEFGCRYDDELNGK